MKVSTVTNSETVWRVVSECNTIVLLAVLKMRPSRSMHLVFFRMMCGLEYSHDHIVERKVSMARMSVATAGAVSLMDGCWDASKSFQRSRGVIAFWRRVGGVDIFEGFE